MSTTLRLAPKAVAKISPERVAAIPAPTEAVKPPTPAKPGKKAKAAKPAPAKPVKVQKTPAEKVAWLAAEKAMARQTAKKRRTEAKALRKTLREQFPLAFNVGQPVPLMIGIDRAIVARLEGVKRRLLNPVLANWTKDISYLRALVAGAARVDLDGNPAGVVSEIDQAHAQARLAAFEAATPVELLVEPNATPVEPQVEPLPAH